MEDSEGAQSASGAGADTPAIALGLTGASRTTADAFLKLQMEEMRERSPYEISHLRLRRFSGWAKAVLELSIGLFALALVAGISLMVWNAAHSDGLVVESFSVPPDMAARGLTGQAIAGQLTDKLSALQADTDSNRAPRSYSNDWGDDIKVEIPDTGVSIGEVYSFLRRWLGHETYVGGDVWRTSAGITIAAHINGGGGAVVGTEAELDALIQKAAEEIYSRTQPYRYAVYLLRQGRTDEGLARFRALAQSRDAKERSWANFGLSVESMDSGSPMRTKYFQKLAASQGIALASGNLGILETDLGHPEAARSYIEKAAELMREGVGDINPDSAAGIANGYAANLFSFSGDYGASLREQLKSIAGRNRSVASPSYLLAKTQLLVHDAAAARKALENILPNPGANAVPGSNVRQRLEAQMAMAEAKEDWAAVSSIGQSLLPALQKYPGQAALVRTMDDPRTAVAEASLGKFTDAVRRIAATPLDCYRCLLARARIAAMRGAHGEAEGWFARAVSSNPSIPFAEAQWGAALLARHQPDAAIEKFKLSNKKGPHFADPLEGWGEALMAINQSHLALAKFAEAEKYAPHWGGLHLKWGEALVYAGKKDEAKAQFARAAQLDLTPAEKAELSRMH